MTEPRNSRRHGPKPGTLTALTVATLLISLSAAMPAQATKQVSDNKPLKIKEADVDFGSGAIDEAIVVKYELENDSAEPIRILGCRVTCGCTIPQDLPFTIQPKEKKTLRIKLILPETPQSFKVSFRVYTSIKEQRYLDLGTHGRVGPKPQKQS